MDFTYGHMYNWYKAAIGTDAFPITDDVKVFVYEANYQAIDRQRRSRPRSGLRYDRDGSTRPFTRPGIVVTRVLDESFADPVMYPHGLYLVTESEDKRVDRKRRMYFVFPFEKRKAAGGVFMAGDHFTFCMDSNDKKTPLHFHLTVYVPDLVQSELGRALHINDYLPSAFTLPMTPDAFLAGPLLKENTVRARGSVIHKLLAHPFTPQPQPQQQGGARRRRNKAPRARGPARRSFDDAWYALPLHRVIMMAVARADGTYDVTMIIHDRAKRKALSLATASRLHGGASPDKGRHGCALYGVPRDRVTPAALEDEFARVYLSHVMWESFKVNLQHDEYEDF